MNNILFFISNHLLLSIIWFFFLFMIIFLSFNKFNFKGKIISSFDAVKLINEKNVTIIDTRSLELYNDGHILNSIHIPLNNNFLKKIQDLNLPSIQPIILIINLSDNNNKYIQKLLIDRRNNIYILNNGMYSWKTDNLPIIVNKKK
ncbi:Uncharacterized protein YibN [Buchnera aphidicola (Protaphis terricola)]|uniref:rhodanese-like domain-containing protein n=1 Tax=Buchnera aphidicola TaxID=9 RepID=UPI003464CE41